MRFTYQYQPLDDNNKIRILEYKTFFARENIFIWILITHHCPYNGHVAVNNASKGQLSQI